MVHPSARQGQRLPAPVRLILSAILVIAAAGPASALIHVDFEPAYFVHPGQQVWDFCLIHDDGLYYIFYHAIPEATPHPSNAKHIWRSTSPDLVHWSDPIIVLSVTEDWYESQAVWAPDLVKNPVSGFWFMAYTGVDQQQNQRYPLKLLAFV